MPMPTITIHVALHGEAAQPYTVRTGQSLMRAATGAGVEAIAADCGGLLSCATCHVIVEAAWASRLPAPSADEASMLEMTAAPRTPTSRLSCQIELVPALDGLALRLPDRQY
jgi:2Fe-2S ferredoxin